MKPKAKIGRPKKWQTADCAGKTPRELWGDWWRKDMLPVIEFEKARAGLPKQRGAGDNRYKLAMELTAFKLGFGPGTSRSNIERLRRRFHGMPGFWQVWAFKLTPAQQKRYDRLMAENPEGTAHIEFFAECWRRHPMNR